MENEYVRAKGVLDGAVVMGTDANPNVEFYMHPEYDKPFCRMQFPGDKSNVWDQPVRDEDKRNNPQAWAVFEAGLERFHGQTRLEDWPACNEARRRHLNANQIYTVEQVAGIADGMLDGIGPGSLEIRNKAQATIAEKKKAAQFDPMREEMATMRAELAELKASQVEKPRRGRPPKNKPKEEAA